VQARFLSMMGLYAVTTPRNDASLGVGEWDLQGAYKYLSEANAGYHWDVNHGLNVDAGIFLSYIGLFSYYNFDNWTYQPSCVSSNTPWFFNVLRVQWFPTQTLKIEPWLINGWQSYAKYNRYPGVGGQILWIPNDRFRLVLNSYSIGQDNLASGSGLPANGGNPTLTGIGDPLDPGVLRLVDAACRGAGPRTPVAVCGELAADELACALLVGLGVRELSVAPRAIPLVKQAVRGLDTRNAAALAASALAAPDAGAVRKLIAGRVSQ